MASMVTDAQKREREYDRKQEKSSKMDGQLLTRGEPRDNSLKAFYREVKKVIEASDVILQVLDARDPMGCRCFEIEKMILERYPNKKVVLILNKIDLVPKENVMIWLKYLRNFFPTLAFKCSTQHQKRNLGHSSVAPELASSSLLGGAECLGGEALLQLLKNYSRSLNIKTSVAVGIIGYPNVGKSSLINSLKRARSVGVAPTPGFTKVAQEVHLDKNVKLLDSPGIVPVRGEIDANVVLRNVVKVEKIDDPVGPVEAIIQRCRKEQLLKIYSIASFSNTTEFLMHIAEKRKKITKGGIADLRAAALSVINDWTGGKIPFHTLPPKTDNIHVGSKIVSAFAEEFNIDQTDLINALPSRTTSNAVESAGRDTEVDTSMFEDEEEEEEEEEDDEDYDDDMEMEDDDDEEDEDEEEDDDEEIDDEMDDGTAEELTALKKQSLQKKLTPKSKVQNLRDEADQYNPQVNKSLKKAMKKQKKKFGTITETSSNERYSFAKDFYNDDEEDEEEDMEDDVEEDIDEDEVF
eukprot:gene17870-21309_t